MIDDKYYAELAKDKWDTYRDLDKIFKDEYSVEQGIDYSNSLLVDSDPRKVQLYLANSICPVDYQKEDAERKPRLYKEKMQLLDDSWHEKHLQDLADFIVDLLDNAENVPDYLDSHPSQFSPPDLLHRKDEEVKSDK